MARLPRGSKGSDPLSSIAPRDRGGQLEQHAFRYMISKELHIGPVNTADNGHLIEARFQVGTQRHPIYFHSSDVALTENIETFVISALLPGMRRGLDLAASGKISRRLMAAIPVAQHILRTWNSSLHEVSIKNLEPTARDRPKRQRVGTFFTGGLDSFYTLLKHEEEITDLIYVHGFDMSLKDISRRRRTSDMIRNVGSELNKDVIEIDTNLQTLFRPDIDWRDLAHGPALAAVGHLLSPRLGKIYISANFSWDNMEPCATHPHLDPLWSSEWLDFVHDGLEATRVDKAAFLSKSDLALQNLRVCTKNIPGIYNCGRCEKCIRTMIHLYISGALDRCTTFDAPLEIKRVLKLRPVTIGPRSHAKANLKALEEIQGAEELREALRVILNRPQWPTKLKLRVQKAVRSLRAYRSIDYLHSNMKYLLGWLE